MLEVEKGSKKKKGSSEFLEDTPNCKGATHPVHAVACGGSVDICIASTPTTSFPYQGIAATGQAPGSLTIRAEEACPSYRLPCQMWRRAALDMNIRLH